MLMFGQQTFEWDDLIEFSNCRNKRENFLLNSDEKLKVEELNFGSILERSYCIGFDVSKLSILKPYGANKLRL